nr:uncharacterized protein LOC123754175 [Procambarus clarkii]
MSGIKRKANFSEEELSVLVDEVKKRESIIFGKQSRQVTTQDKHCAWSQVAVAVSGVGLCSRQQADVRKKFQDLNSSVKKKLAENAREMRKTGGGECDTQPLTNYEENLSTLQSSTSAEGIAGISDAGQDYTVEEPNCVTEEVVMDTDDSQVLNVQKSGEPSASPIDQFHPSCLGHDYSKASISSTHTRKKQMTAEHNTTQQVLMLHENLIDVVHKVPAALKDVAAEVHEGNKSLKEVAKAVDVGNKSFKEVVKEVQDLNKSLKDISKGIWELVECMKNNQAL